MKSKTVLITGAGGSIGSALAHEIAKESPHLLVLFDLCEHSLYDVDRKLQARKIAVLGDCKDAGRLAELPAPDYVFHCAAYKHVPMLESKWNEKEGYRNNVDGTLAVMASFPKAERIVLLSSDKAVNPCNTMGRSKRDSEKLAKKAGRSVARLGNVMGSSGSVMPLFAEQIEAGGPVTVTHAQVTRYLLPMEKAVKFIRSVADRKPGVYEAEMGRPMKILDLARQMIGNRDIKIEFTGLRPGEKMHEELEGLAA